MKQSKIERIAVRAYEIWEQEGRPPGRAEEHWRRAEQEVAAAMNTGQMGSEREVGTRPAPRLEAAPPLSEAMAPPGEASPQRARRKTAASRKRGEWQQG